MYVLRRGNASLEQGLAYYDGIEVFDKKNPRSLPLQQCAVSSGHIDFDPHNNRIVYQQSLSRIGVMPMLHFTNLNFFSMPERSQILVTKRDKDRYMVMTSSAEIYTWSMTTAKLLEYYQTEHKDYIKDFKLFGTGKKAEIHELNQFSQSAFFYDYSLI